MGDPEKEPTIEDWAEAAGYLKPMNLRGDVIGMEYGDAGVTLTVVVKYPEAPPIPQDLDKQPEDVKAEVHAAQVLHWRQEYSLNQIRLGPMILQHPGGTNPFLRALFEEESNWATHMEMVEKRAGAQGARP
jgi:hypothetical protein